MTHKNNKLHMFLCPFFFFLALIILMFCHDWFDSPFLGGFLVCCLLYLCYLPPNILCCFFVVVMLTLHLDRTGMGMGWNEEFLVQIDFPYAQLGLPSSFITTICHVLFMYKFCALCFQFTIFFFSPYTGCIRVVFIVWGHACTGFNDEIEFCFQSSVEDK